MSMWCAKSRVSWTLVSAIRVVRDLSCIFPINPQHGGRTWSQLPRSEWRRMRPFAGKMAKYYVANRYQTVYVEYMRHDSTKRHMISKQIDRCTQSCGQCHGVHEYKIDWHRYFSVVSASTFNTLMSAYVKSLWFIWHLTALSHDSDATSQRCVSTRTCFQAVQGSIKMQ